MPVLCTTRCPVCVRHGALSIAHLSVYEHDRAEQAPRAALPVHVQHAQDLQEADAADGRGGEHLAIGADREHHDAGHHHDQICPTQVHTDV